MPSAKPETVIQDLLKGLAPLVFGEPISHIYNPLRYAGGRFMAYWSRYGASSRRILLLGMNPGPWGMVQTGVPFGDVEMVRDWLGLEGPVGQPGHLHPKRPVLGFACPRQEVSGRRLWGWARSRFGSPRSFFKEFWVANYCPLAFMERSGRNRTPDHLPAGEKRPLFAVCDQALRDTVALFQPAFVIGVGGFAAARARDALVDFQGVIGRVTHPSPANPHANKGWDTIMDKELKELGI